MHGVTWTVYINSSNPRTPIRFPFFDLIIEQKLVIWIISDDGNFDGDDDDNAHGNDVMVMVMKIMIAQFW
jgi:hypothetical protein